MAKIFGFTLLRNGIKYDYSFSESLNSLSPIVEKIYIALGNSEDGTEQALDPFSCLRILPTIWDTNSRDGAVILSEQTNIALMKLREEQGENRDAWGIYLQADEILHQDDYDLIKKDIERANQEGCDALSFRYLHFWQSHFKVAINKKWYPQEIRAVKLNSDAVSWGDAQSFKNVKKVFQSEARIFHYGHVREAESYKIKKRDILKLYHKDEKLSKYQMRERRFDSQTEVLDYLGTHPSVMTARIKRLESFDPRQVIFKSDLIIVDNSQKYSKVFLKKIAANSIVWAPSIYSPFLRSRAAIVIPYPNTYQRWIFPSKVPDKMRSKLALPWPREFLLTLKLSEKGIAVLD